MEPEICLYGQIGVCCCSTRRSPCMRGLRVATATGAGSGLPRRPSGLPGRFRSRWPISCGAAMLKHRCGSGDSALGGRRVRQRTSKPAVCGQRILRQPAIQPCQCLPAGKRRGRDRLEPVARRRDQAHLLGTVRIPLVRGGMRTCLFWSAWVIGSGIHGFWVPSCCWGSITPYAADSSSFLSFGSG